MSVQVNECISKQRDDKVMELYLTANGSIDNNHA